MVELGHLTWLSAKMATKSPDPIKMAVVTCCMKKATQLRWQQSHLTLVKMVVRSHDLSQNGSSHMLYEKAMIFELPEF